MLFEQFSIITQAAKASLGVALLPEFIIKEELKRGELVALINKPTQSNSSYYLVAPQENTNYQPFCVFRDWLLKNIDKRSCLSWFSLFFLRLPQPFVGF